MNFDKYNPEKCWEDFDAVEFMGERFHKQSESGKDLFVLDRHSAFMLLKAHKYTLDSYDKAHICKFLEMVKNNGGNFPNPPKTPIKINVTNKQIIDGVTRLHTALYQRTPRIVWMEFET